MTTKKVEPLRLIGKSNGCKYYITSNTHLPNTLLKVYENPLTRLLTSYTTKGLVGSTAETNIEEANQGRIIRLSNIGLRDWDKYYGRVLFVTAIEPIPIDFIFEGKEEETIPTQNGEVISRSEALSRLPFDDKSGALDDLYGKIASIFAKAQRCFQKENLFIENMKLNFGVRACGDDPLALLWAGEGITPNTAVILNGDEKMINCVDFAVKMIPPRVLEREMAGNRANASPSFLF